MNPRRYRVLSWFGMAAAGIVGQAPLQEVPAPFVAAYAIACRLRAGVDRLELNGTHRRFADLAA